MIKNFLLKRGDQLGFTITFTSTTPVATMEFGVKKNYTDENFVIYKTLGNGITKLSDIKYQIVVPSAETATLTDTSYDFDLRFTYNEVAKTPLSGKILIKETVFEV